MTTLTIDGGHGAAPHADHEHHDPADTLKLGFWVYLMSDCVLFSGLFATFAVMNHAFAGGPTPKTLFDLPYVAGETALLLLSSLTSGVAMVAAYKGKRNATIAWFIVTALFGLGFLGMEVSEFSRLVAEGAGPQRSGFLSAFFTLVGTHGLHVTSGLIWMTVLMIQVAMRGITPVTMRRLVCLSLFWHFLDIVWIGVFSFVYIMGVAA